MTSNKKQILFISKRGKMHKTAVFSAVATGFAVCLRQKGVEFFFWVCYNVGNQSQGSYIGNTTASQAVKAGSIPVPCSKKKDTPPGCPFYATGIEPIAVELSGGQFQPPVQTLVATIIFAKGENANRFPYPAPKKKDTPPGCSSFFCDGNRTDSSGAVEKIPPGSFARGKSLA